MSQHVSVWESVPDTGRWATRSSLAERSPSFGDNVDETVWDNLDDLLVARSERGVKVERRATYKTFTKRKEVQPTVSDNHDLRQNTGDRYGRLFTGGFVCVLIGAIVLAADYLFQMRFSGSIGTGVLGIGLIMISLYVMDDGSPAAANE